MDRNGTGGNVIALTDGPAPASTPHFSYCSSASFPATGMPVRAPPPGASLLLPPPARGREKKGRAAPRSSIPAGVRNAGYRGDMIATATGFDTLTYARRLKAVCVAEAQAEASAEAVRDALCGIEGRPRGPKNAGDEPARRARTASGFGIVPGRSRVFSNDPVDAPARFVQGSFCQPPESPLRRAAR